MGKFEPYSRRELRRRRWVWLRGNRLVVAVVAVGIAVMLATASTAIITSLNGPARWYLLGAVQAGLLAAAAHLLQSAFLAHDREAIWHVRGAWGEENTRSELQRAKRRRVIWGWVDSISLQIGDLDHVVETRHGGLIVLDSKWRSEVTSHDATEMARAANRAKSRAEGVARSVFRSDQGAGRTAKAPAQRVIPAVVVWGAAQRTVPDGTVINDVAFVPGRKLLRWLRDLDGEVITTTPIVYSVACRSSALLLLGVRRHGHCADGCVTPPRSGVECTRGASGCAPGVGSTRCLFGVSQLRRRRSLRLSLDELDQDPGMRTRCHASLLVVVALIVTAGCRSDGAGDDNFYRAEAAFRTCVEKHGAGVEALEIKGDGVAKLVYDEDTPPSLYDKVARKCETLILPMLQSGGAEPSPSEAPSEGAGLPPVPPSVETVADYVTQLQRTGFDGAVLIGTEEAVSDGAGLGFADPAGKLPNTTDTVFDVGSVAKMFTAVAVLEAIERGRLAYDAKLGDLLPAAPPDKTEITVQQLLTHRSGLGEYHDTEGDFERMTRARATKVILSHDLAFEPGSNRAYSNSGYTLLAIILERVLSEPFTAAVTRMFDLLQMSQTGFYGSDRLKDEQVAVGHENRSHGSNRPDQWQPTWALLGAGGIASSVEDLHRWITGVHSGRLLAPDSVQDLYDEVLTNTPQILPGERIVGYAGANDFGFETTVVELLDSGQHVIVSSNSNAPDGAVSTEAALVLAQLLQQ